jgi:alpha-galactosidase
VDVRPDGPIVLTTSSAEFQIPPSGYIQASLLKPDERVTLDVPRAEEHLEWLILDKDGKHARMTRDLATLCPALPEVQAYYQKLTEKLATGDSMDRSWTISTAYPCVATRRITTSLRRIRSMAWARSIGAIFQTSRALKPESVTQSCPCGTPPSLAWLPFIDQAVTADPVGAVQVRRRIKMYKALLGPESSVYGDHVELSAMDRIGNHWREHGEDFASTIGAGGVVGTKFVWPDPGPKFKSVTLTQNEEEHWKKWIDIYNH